MAKKTTKKTSAAKPKAKKSPAKKSALKKSASAGKAVTASKKKAGAKAAKPVAKKTLKASPKPTAKPTAKSAKKTAKKVGTQLSRKPAAKSSPAKPFKKTAKKRAAGARAIEVEVLAGSTFNPDTTEAANFAEDALAEDALAEEYSADDQSVLDAPPAIPPRRDDLLTTASPSHAAALRQLRETDPTYAAGVVDAKTFATNAARLLHDDNCSDVLVLDVHGLRQDCDYIVIGSGTSDRQMRGVAKEVEQLGEKQGFKVYRKHADERATWILADFVHVVVHLFEPNTRATYDIEMMWADAPRLAWEREDQVNRNRAGVG
jgi:ribosome-associated protein